MVLMMGESSQVLASWDPVVIRMNTTTNTSSGISFFK